MNVDDKFFAEIEPRIQKAFSDMAALEKGAIANHDENRMVGHYWLRSPELAPTPQIQTEIKETLAGIKRFADQVHTGAIQGVGGKFKNYLLIGIGGSALGPQFVAQALGHPRTDKLKPYFFDNTDPDGMERTVSTIGSELCQTLCIVISKSGGTKETRNGMVYAKAAFEKQGLDFSKHAVAITMQGSELDKLAARDKWITRFPMWDWVGGRTSELSAVGLLPAALQGFNVDELLLGAAECDSQTRQKVTKANPAALIAAAWYRSGDGKGLKSMVVLPYKDRLELFSKYLQQLVMESLGKERDNFNKIVNQGITVYGNKGATDQHSYIQQLRDGQNNFFATFVEVLSDEQQVDLMVEKGISVNDYLNGFYLGTRQALTENERESITITIDKINPRSIGCLIALFERAVGFYANLISINAYHQPGVEAGKKAAGRVIEIQNKIQQILDQSPGMSLTLEELAKKADASLEIEIVFKICNRLVQNKYCTLEKIADKSYANISYRKK